MASNNNANKKNRKTVATAASPPNSNSDSEANGARDNEEFEPGSWECTDLVCTYRNKYEAFKCSICDTRKGTSTRKPRLNPSVVQQQTLVQKLAAVEQKKQRNNSEARNSPDFLASPMFNNSFPTTSDTSHLSITMIGQQCKTNQTTEKISRRRPLPLRDALVVRSSAKKFVVTVDGKNHTITEFKPRISSRGRKKLTNNVNTSAIGNSGTLKTSLE